MVERYWVGTAAGVRRFFIMGHGSARGGRSRYLSPFPRLAGIDCPERKQPWGQRAKQALSDYVFNQQVTVDWDKLDLYKRVVGKVLDGHRDVNLALVRDGMCWWYRKYAREQSPVDQRLYEAAEAKAKEERKGLWVDPEPVPPWDWRRR